MLAHFSLTLALGFAVAFPCLLAHDTLRGAQAQLDEHSATASSKSVHETAPAVIPTRGDLHFWVLGFRAKTQGMWNFYGPQLTEDPAIVVFTEGDAHDWVASSQGREQTPKDSWDQAKAYFGLHFIRRAGKIHRVSPSKSHSVWGKPALTGAQYWSQGEADDAARILLFREFGLSQDAHAKVEAYLENFAPKKAAPQASVLIKGQAQSDDAPRKKGPHKKGVIPRRGDLHLWVLGFRAKDQGMWSFYGPQLTEDPAIVVFTKEGAQAWVERRQGREQTPRDSWDQANAYFGLHCIRRAGKIHRVSPWKSHSVWGEPALSGAQYWSQGEAADAARILLFREFGLSQDARAKVEAYLEDFAPKEAAPQALEKGQVESDEPPKKGLHKKGWKGFLSNIRQLFP